MSEQSEAAIEQRVGKRRFIACTQSTGRVGKSTVAEGLITWLRYAGIEFGAIDADSQHQTLFHRYPGEVAIFDATKTFDDFASMIQTLPASPVILVDFPAQATDFLLSAAKHFWVAGILRAVKRAPYTPGLRSRRSYSQGIGVEYCPVLRR